MSEIKKIDVFFFKDGQKKFNALVEFANNKGELVNDTLNALIKRKQQKKYSISEWVKELDKDKNTKDLIEKINEFVSYCDVNALGANNHQIKIGKDSKGNEIKVTAIAKAYVFQHIWVEQILKYLNGTELEKLSHSVRNAIKYFEEPANRFPILSEGHRQKIREYYKLDETWNNIPEKDEKFDNALKLHAENNWNEFKDYDKDPEVNSYKNKYNLTYAYSVEIYKQRSQWDCEVDTTLLEKNRNLILTGAPGTGKTFLARQMAKKLTKNNTQETDDKKENNPIGFVQFHPSYDYTDFVEGLRPTADDKGNIVFKREDGVFKAFCKRAANDKKEDNKYVFIIDEINRGEISKIFGELFFSIDPGYRVERKEETQSNAEEETNKIIKVDTQYQNMVPVGDPFKEGFYVPNNVYIIGTMNDIDRSVESMDFAFRRRFAFQEITAEDTMDSILYQLGDDETIAINKMRAINKTLNELGLNSNYHIGAAYFMKALNYLGKSGKATENTWDQLWKLHLKGTLFEYFRGEPDANENLKQLEKAYYNAK